MHVKLGHKVFPYFDSGLFQNNSGPVNILSFKPCGLVEFHPKISPESHIIRSHIIYINLFKFKVAWLFGFTLELKQKYCKLIKNNNEPQH